MPGGAFAAGLVSGAVLTLGLIALLEKDGAAIPADSQQSGESAVEATPTQTNSDFQFYTLLNELEVAVPDSAMASAQETEQTVYWLQAASFRDLADADRMRASLLLLNLDASISQVNYRGTLWHRVMVGAFESRTQMASARETLLENNIQPLLLMEKQPAPTSER